MLSEAAKMDRVARCNLFLRSLKIKLRDASGFFERENFFCRCQSESKERSLARP